MRTTKILAIVALIMFLTSNAVFAAPDVDLAKQHQQTDSAEKAKKDIEKGKDGHKGQQDPVKALENQKKEIQTLLKEGKIDKEKAEKKLARIDARIEEFRKFNSLTLQQKKEMLIGNYRAFTEKKVKDGKMSRDKAAELLKAYTAKVSQWDGSGYPGFVRKGLSGKCHKK